MRFENSQWAVTEDGLDTIESEPFYEIDAADLVKTVNLDGDIYYDWPLHMAAKTWLDVEAFIEAFTLALDVHRRRLPFRVDPDLLQKSLLEVRRTHARVRQRMAEAELHRVAD